MAEIKVFVAGNYMPDFSKSIHYITWTPRTDWPMKYGDDWVPYSGMSYPFAVLYFAGIDPIPYFLMVDRHCETGTLYPEHNITVMPSGVFENEEIYKHFGDAVEAQKMIRAENIIFDFRFYNYIYPRTYELDNYEYYKMIDYNKNRFDFEETKVRIFILVGQDDVINRRVKSFYHSEQYYANQEDLALI